MKNGKKIKFQEDKAHGPHDPRFYLMWLNRARAFRPLQPPIWLLCRSPADRPMDGPICCRSAERNLSHPFFFNLGRQISLCRSAADRTVHWPICRRSAEKTLQRSQIAIFLRWKRLLHVTQFSCIIFYFINILYMPFNKY